MKYLLEALSFLTILPVSNQSQLRDIDFAKIVSFFPVVGAIIGLICAIALSLLMSFVDPLSCAIIIVAVMVFLSGALHMDGLADTFDGFLSSRPRSEKLEIMHDSQIGTMGALAMVFIILLKVSLLFSISANRELMLVVVFLMPIAGRVAQVVSMSILPYAREDGLAKSFWTTREARARPATIFLLVISTIVGIISSQVGLLDGLFFTAFVLAVIYLFSRWCDKSIEGGTGDTLGAITEIVELATLFYFAI